MPVDGGARDAAIIVSCAGGIGHKTQRTLQAGGYALTGKELRMTPTLFQKRAVQIDKKWLRSAIVKEVRPS